MLGSGVTSSSAPPVLVFVAACAVSGGTLAAYTASTSASNDEVEAGSVHLTDNGAGSAGLGLANAGAGASDASCIRVASDGSLASAVRLRGASSGSLAGHLNVKVERGSGAGAFDDCNGFAPDERDSYGEGDGVLYDGRLSDLPPDWATGVQDPSESLLATSILPVFSARTGLVGLWELGERTRAADDFAGTSGAVLTTRAPLLGTAWARHAVSTTNAVFTASGRIRPQNAGTAIYRLGTANGAEVVSADFTVRSASGEAGLLTRMATTGDTGYLVRYRADAGVWELATDNAGTIVVLASWAGAVPDGETAHVVFDQSGTSIQVSIDGTIRLTATDGTIVATARSGFRLVGVGPQDDGTGVHVDNFRSVSPNQASNVSTLGTAPVPTGAPVVTAGAQPSATDVQWGMNFNGTSQTLGLPLPTTPAITDTFTVGGWFKLVNGSNLLRDATTGTASGTSLGFDDGSGTLKFRSGDEVFDTGVSFRALRGSWHHHALVRSGTAVQYYLDGRLVFSATATTSTAPTSPLYLMRDGAGTAYSSGSVDQVGLWNRALTPAELAAIRDGIAAPADWASGDAHWYRTTVTVDEDPAAQSSSATGQLTWEARSR